MAHDVAALTPPARPGLLSDLDRPPAGSARRTRLRPDAAPPLPPPCCALCVGATGNRVGSRAARDSAGNSPPPSSLLRQTPTSNSDSHPAASAHTALGRHWRASLKARLSMPQLGSNGVAPSHLYALRGHVHLLGVCRIHSASQWLMTSPRLHPRPDPVCCRISIGLLPVQHVERGFGQMPRHRSHRLAVPFALAQPEIELAHVPLGTALVIHRHRVPCFGKRPLQIAIHIRPRPPIPHSVATGVHL